MNLKFLPREGHGIFLSTHWRRKLVVSAVLMTCFFSAHAQGVYTSANNKTQNWESPSTWTKGQTWMAEPSTMTSVGGSDAFTINGYVTRNGNLGVTGSGGLVINDTLVILGDLTMTTSTGITVGPNGLLVVLGGFSTSGGGNKINVTGNGRVAIVGEYNQTDGSVTTGNAFYIYDDTPTFTTGNCNGGTVIDGVPYTCPPSAATLAALLDDEQDLSNNDPPLEDFMESLGVTCGFANLVTGANQTVCSNGTVAALAAGAVSPGTYLWESSTTSATSGFTSATNTNNTQTYTPSGLTQTTWFRRKVTRSGCTNTSSGVIVITIEANGTWRGTTNTSWANAANWCGGIPTSTTDVVIKTNANGRYPAISAAADARNITITTGTSVTLSSNTLNVYGSVANSGTWTTTGGTVAFRGTAAQTVTGGPFTFGNLTINNTSGTQVSFNNNVTVSGTLTLSAGKVNLGGNTLTMGTASNVRGTLANPVGATSWIFNGTMSRWMPANTVIADGNYQGYFPVGSASDFRPFWIAMPTNASRMTTAGTIRISHTADNTAIDVNYNDNGVFIKRRQNSSWTVATGNGIAGGTFDIKVGGTGLGTIADPSHLRVMRPAAAAPGTNGTPSVTGGSYLAARNGVTLVNFPGAFYIGSIDGTTSPLPVELISFTATTAVEGISVDWKSASEDKFDYYELQRAGEDLEFLPIAKIENQGGHRLITSYNFLDDKPLPGKNYYRLRSVDIDGSFDFSNVTSAGWAIEGFNAYPNPVVDKSFTLEVEDKASQSVIVIYTSLGKEILRQFVTSRETITLPAHTEPGVYFLKLVGQNKVIKLVVQ